MPSDEYRKYVEGARIAKVRERIYDEVSKERDQQDFKWGDQHHNVLTWSVILSEESGEVSKAALESYFGGKPMGDVREECIQVAAVAIAIIEKIDAADKALLSPYVTETEQVVKPLVDFGSMALEGVDPVSSEEFGEFIRDVRRETSG